MNASPSLSDYETSNMAGATVEFSEVSKSYGTLRVLQPTSLTIDRGEFFGIIGPSGSSKSTLLGIVAGFTPATSGKICVNGIDVMSLPTHRRDIGMVFQGYALFPHMTVADNIAFPLKMRRMSREEIERGVRRALSMVRLEKFADRQPSQLSGGQQQRVALARASVYNPPLLLMDEPLGALDKNLREEMQEEIKSLQSKLGATVLYVTHDQHEAAFMADRLAVMDQGRVTQIGSPREIYERPMNRFVAGFLGEASILEATAIGPEAGGQAAFELKGGLKTFACVASGAEPVTALCLRPENIVLGAKAKDLRNCYQGLVTEATFTTGSVRYRVTIGNNIPLTVRVATHPGIPLVDPGTSVPVGWDPASVSTLSD